MSRIIKHNIRGFTLLELLVVIGIIGLLSTIVVVQLNSSRIKSRDAKRLQDIKSLQTAMEFVYDDNANYNLSGGVGLCDSAGDKVSQCTSISTYLASIADFADPSGTTACTAGSSSVCDYAFGSDPDAQGQSYTVYFYLEGASAIGNTGAARCSLTSTNTSVKVSCP